MEGDTKTWLLKKFGILEDETKNKKLSVKYASLSEYQEPGINHFKSQHTLSLQRSKYICIDDRVDKEFVMKNHQKLVLNETPKISNNN